MFDIHVSEASEETSDHITTKPMDPRRIRTVKHEDMKVASTFTMGTHTCRIGNETSPTVLNEGKMRVE